MRTLYYGGHIHTMRMPGEVFTAMGVEGERIVYLGDMPAIEGEGYDRVVPLEGMHVYPSLTDSHLHLLETVVLAASSFEICLTEGDGVKPDTLKGVEGKIRSYCREHPRQKIIVASGYIQSAVKEKRLPTRRELDRWTDNRSIVVYNIDGHSSSLSTSMMKRLKLPVEGSDGRFSGKAHDFMQGRVTKLIASTVTPSMLARGIGNFSNTCASFGIGRVCALDGNGDIPKDPLTKMLAFLSSRMDIDVRLFPQYMDYDRAKWFFPRQRHKRAGGCSAWELDGSVGSHSAAFYGPYRDTGEKRRCYYGDSVIRGKVEEGLKRGIQLTCHAIGEAAIDQILGAYAGLLPDKEPVGAKKNARPDGEPGPAVMGNSAAKEDGETPLPRIDHFEFPSPEAVEQIKRLPLSVTVQPGFSWLDKRYLKSYEQFLPEETIRRQVPLKELVEAGVCVCGSSDSPVQSVNPYEQIRGMVDFYLPEQSLTPYEALRTYTVNPSVMLGEAGGTGTLEIGKEADFMVTGQELCGDGSFDWADVRAEYLVIRGRRYRRKKGSVPELMGMLFRRKKWI